VCQNVAMVSKLELKFAITSFSLAVFKIVQDLKLVGIVMGQVRMFVLQYVETGESYLLLKFVMMAHKTT